LPTQLGRVWHCPAVGPVTVIGCPVDSKGLNLGRLAHSGPTTPRYTGLAPLAVSCQHEGLYVPEQFVQLV